MQKLYGLCPINLEFEIEIPDADWIKQISTRSLSEHAVNFFILANEGTKSRSANILFTNKENEEQKYTGFSEWEITAPSTDLAKQWQGWGTALKPSFEPIIVARKPFKGSLVDNIIKYGVCQSFFVLVFTWFYCKKRHKNCL